MVAGAAASAGCAARRMFSGRIATSTLSPARERRRARRPRARDRRRDLDRAAAVLALAHLARHQVHQPHEVGHHAVRRPGIDLERRAVLLQAAAIHHRDLVGQRQRLGLVVGDIDEGDAGAALQLLELDAHALAQLGVEIGQRLVEQQDVGLDHQRARQRDALLLAAGQFVRIAALEPGQVDQRQRLLDLALAPRRAGTLRIFRPNTTFSNTVLCGQTA